MSIYIRMTTPFIFLWFSRTDTDTETKVTILLITDTPSYFWAEHKPQAHTVSFLLIHLGRTFTSPHVFFSLIRWAETTTSPHGLLYFSFPSLCCMVLTSSAPTLHTQMNHTCSFLVPYNSTQTYHLPFDFVPCDKEPPFGAVRPLVNHITNLNTLTTRSCVT